MEADGQVTNEDDFCMRHFSHSRKLRFYFTTVAREHWVQVDAALLASRESVCVLLTWLKDATIYLCRLGYHQVFKQILSEFKRDSQQ